MRQVYDLDWLATCHVCEWRMAGPTANSKADKHTKETKHPTRLIGKPRHHP